MISPHIRAIWPHSGRVAYQASLNGRMYATHWLELRGEVTAGVFAFASHLELDPGPLGQGGSRLYAQSELLVDGDLRPLRYATRARGSGLAIEWRSDAIVVTLPDGSTQRLPVGAARYVVETHFTGLEAVMLAHMHACGQLGESARTTLFFVNQLSALPYALTPAVDLPAPDGAAWVRSSFHEEILLDAGGQLLSLRTPMQGIEIRRLTDAPPLPDASVAGSSFRPARYVPPNDPRFRLEEVTIPGPITPIGGTLSLPNDAMGGRLPAVLFISGSGAHDRHGMSGELDLGTHEILDHLAACGIAGLRFDTRGAGNTRIGDDVLQSGFRTIIDDARAAYAYLKTRPEIDPDRVALIGHSQGGTVALAMLTRFGDGARALALLATVGRTMAEVSVDQLHVQAKVTGLSDDQLQKQLVLTHELYDLLRSDKPWVAGEIPDVHMAAARMVPWLREWLQYASDDMIPALRCPLWIGNGDKDFQVDAERDGARMYAAAVRAGVDATFKRYPNLDHLFMAQDGPAGLASYYQPGRHVDRAFLEDLTTWLRDRLGVAPVAGQTAAQATAQTAPQGRST